MLGPRIIVREDSSHLHRKQSSPISYPRFNRTKSCVLWSKRKKTSRVLTSWDPVSEGCGKSLSVVAQSLLHLVSGQQPPPWPSQDPCSCWRGQAATPEAALLGKTRESLRENRRERCHRVRLDQTQSYHLPTPQSCNTLDFLRMYSRKENLSC